MIVLAILSTLAALLWAAFVVFANGMSDAPTMPFQGGWTIAVGALVAAALWVAWWVG